MYKHKKYTGEALRPIVSFLNSVFPLGLRWYFFEKIFKSLKTPIKEEPKITDPYKYGEDLTEDIRHYVDKTYPSYLKKHAFKKLLRK